MRGWTLLLLSALVVACAGNGETPPPPGPGPEEGVPGETANGSDPEGGLGPDTRGAAPDAPPPTTEAFRGRIDAIQALVEAHDYEQALKEIETTLTQRPPDDLARYLEGLRVGLKRDLLQSLYVDALIILDKSRVALGTPITGQIVIVNLSNHPLVIPEEAGANRTTIQLDLRYTEYDVGGTVLNERRQHPVHVGEDITLGPGERHTEPIVLDSLDFGPERTNFRTYQLHALMYPAEIRIGDETWPGNLRFKSARCEVFPRNYEHLEKDPLKRLDEAVSKNSPIHVPLASALVKTRDKKKAIDKLVGFLRRDWGEDPDGPTRVACCVGLRILTGKDIPAHPDRWLEWADQRR